MKIFKLIKLLISLFQVRSPREKSKYKVFNKQKENHRPKVVIEILIRKFWLCIQKIKINRLILKKHLKQRIKIVIELFMIFFPFIIKII